MNLFFLILSLSYNGKRVRITNSTVAGLAAIGLAGLIYLCLQG